MTSAPTLDRTRPILPKRSMGERSAVAPAPRQWPWLLGGAVGAFTIPFVFADVLGLNRDVYYGLYILFVGVLCVSWARSTRVDARAMMLRNWRAGVALGAIFAGVTSLMVIRTEDATSHPQGLAFAGAIVWRGVLYGMTDGVLLSVFPILVVFAALRDKRRGAAGWPSALRRWRRRSCSRLSTTSAIRTFAARSCASLWPAISCGAFLRS